MKPEDEDKDDELCFIAENEARAISNLAHRNESLRSTTALYERALLAIAIANNGPVRLVRANSEISKRLADGDLCIMIGVDKDGSYLDIGVDNGSGRITDFFKGDEHEKALS